MKTIVNFGHDVVIMKRFVFHTVNLKFSIGKWVDIIVLNLIFFELFIVCMFPLCVCTKIQQKHYVLSNQAIRQNLLHPLFAGTPNFYNFSPILMGKHIFLH